MSPLNTNKQQTLHVIVTIYSCLTLINSQCERSQVLCSDILYSGSVWGGTATGVSLGAYTSDQLQYIGCDTGTASCTPTSFYCRETTTSMTFGSTETGSSYAMRALLGPGTWPSTWTGCASSSNKRGLCNAPEKTSDINKLCQQLGYESGTFVNDNSNLCPEPHWDSNSLSWTSDWISSEGNARSITCNNPCVPTPLPTSNPTPAPTNNPTPSPTEDPSVAPSKTPTKFPSNNPTKTPSSTPTKPPTAIPTVSPSNNPTIAPTKKPTAPTPVIIIKDNTPSPTDAEGANAEDDATTTQTLKSEKGEENITSNDTEINWSGWHLIMFYIIIAVLLCIIILMAIFWRRSHNKTNERFMALRSIQASIPYNNVGAQSPRSMEMGSMGHSQNVSTFPSSIPWGISGNIMNNDMMQYMDTGDLPKENAEQNNNQFIGNDASNIPQIAITNDGMNAVNAPNEGNNDITRDSSNDEEEEEEEDGLYTDPNDRVPVTSGNTMVPDEYLQ